MTGQAVESVTLANSQGLLLSDVGAMPSTWLLDASTLTLARRLSFLRKQDRGEQVLLLRERGHKQAST